ncbi:MAG: hypothetical protein WAK48_14540 [Candidatus Acidiferrum sp.]|jgi:hypothetical protein
MRSNKQIAALVQTALVKAALTAGMMTAAPMFGQTSQVDNPDWPLRSSEIHWPQDTRRQTRTYSLITSC